MSTPAKAFRLTLPEAIAGRLDVFDELKGLAIILIILYHAGGVLTWGNHLHGDLGVDIFVILSGAGLTLGRKAASAREFFHRRLVRVIPAYWIVLTVYLISHRLILGRVFSSQNILLHYLGVHAWFGDAYAMEINDSFWFITFILSVYVFYWFTRDLVDKPDKFLLVGAIAVTVPTLILFFLGQAAVFGHLGLRLPGFLVGVLLGRLLRDGTLEIPLSAALGCAVLILLYIPYTQGIQFGTVITGIALIVGYALFARSLLSAGITKTLKFLGDRSLEIFLIHQPLLRDYNVYACNHLLGTEFPSPFALVVGMAVSVAVTILLSTELHGFLAKLPFLSSEKAKP